MLETPVAFFIFNRPDTTRRVFEEIAKVEPRQLLIVADGPRSDRPGEEARCAQARAIVEQISWDCNVLRNYSDTNLGCKQRVSSGLNWVFDQCEDAIILEDDCLPHASFFIFCSNLLSKYRDNDRIMTISGNNFQSGIQRGNGDYYFSRYQHIWGWATWRRAWKHYDVAMHDWPQLKDTTWLNQILNNLQAVRYWQTIMNKCYENEIDTWDIQWLFTCWHQDGIAIIPNYNLVANIGFGEDATHTVNDLCGVSNLKTYEFKFPLTHPQQVRVDITADNFTFNRVYAKEQVNHRLARRITNYLNKIFIKH